MKKLLMGITLSEIGGSQKVVFSIMTNLPEDEYDITLLTSPGCELLEWIKNLNRVRKNKIKVIEMACLHRNISIIHDAMAFIRILVELYKTKYDIVHFHNTKMGSLGRIAAHIARLPRIYYTVHGWGLNPNTTGFFYRIMSLLERIAASCTTKIVFLSAYDMETGLRNRWASRQRSCIICNGIADTHGAPVGLRKTFDIPSELPIIVFVARMSEPKNPLFAIQMAEYIRRKSEECMLLLIGDGPLFSKCVNLIQELQIENRVLMLGKRDDVRELLQEADIFCLFSKWEGLPISIIEAMFASLPVLASNVGGVPELVIHGENGFIVDNSRPEKAAEYMITLIKDKGVRHSMGNLGRIIAIERFNLENMVGQYRQLYEE